ncbi:hypothetical protein [Acinetobacter indicus]|uniref:hypothetical protein n=1 Tax=Acinetobacter indicus TaxID=756892 RepID=UPI00197BBA0F|nr:hypothetical protein [Acinetobacter indicus]QSG84941.1 hypothetical protein JYB86_02005 [Acinetobacter indicus]
MTAFEIRPQEIYLLERYSSAEYFKELVDAFEQTLTAAERALELFMSDLPYDYRDRHISEQPDVVWGEHVLPNFRSTMTSLQYAYRRLLDGDLSALQYAGNVITDFRAQGVDYWPDWMDADNLEQFDQEQAKANQVASNINSTIFGCWVMGSLSFRYNVDARGNLDLPKSLPVYRLSPYIYINTGETVPQDGIYVPLIEDASAQLMLKGHDAQDALVGLSKSGLQYAREEPTEWILVERIADEGGSLATVESTSLKAFAGQNCPQSGYWWSPANQLQSCYFEQGEVFPEFENNSWGETIWYLEVTNKK